MSSAEPIGHCDSQQLLELARRSIEQGLDGSDMMNLGLDGYSPVLSKPGASFVTLELGGELRGCIGHLDARQPLLQDVVENAYLAAFNDPRFAPLTAQEYSDIDLSISILSPAEPVDFVSEQDLCTKIRPGVDGLILRQGSQQGTFLPSVWATLPEPRDFLRQLKTKAGLAVDHWSEAIEVSRYTVQLIHEVRP